MARKKVNPFLDEDLWRRLKACCAMLDRQPSRELEAMIREWLDRHEAEAKSRMEVTDR